MGACRGVGGKYIIMGSFIIISLVQLCPLRMQTLQLVRHGNYLDTQLAAKPVQVVTSLPRY